MSYHRLLTALLAAVTVPIATAAAFGQLGLQQGQGQEPRPRIWVGGDRGFGRMRREPAKWADRANFDGQYNFCRVFYTSDRGENGGMGWWTDYPGADNNFSVRLAELTFVNVKMKPDGAARPHRAAPHRSPDLPLSRAAHGGRRHRPLQR